MRLFVGIPFPAAALKAAEERAEYVRENSARGNYTDRGNLHLTLAFLGDVEDAAAVAKALSEVRWTAFPIRIGGLGAFPSRGTTTVYAACDGGAPLLALAAAVRSALRASGISFDEKPFTPHLTLVRESDLSASAVARGSFPAIDFRAERYVLFESLRLDGRLVYRALSTFLADDARR